MVKGNGYTKAREEKRKKINKKDRSAVKIGRRAGLGSNAQNAKEKKRQPQAWLDLRA